MPGKHVDIEQDKWLRAQLQASHRAWVALEAAMGEYDMAGLIVKEVRFQGPAYTGGDCRIIVKAVDESGKGYIAFGGGDTPREAMLDLVKRSAAQGLKWRDDVPFADRASGGGAKGLDKRADKSE